MPKYNCTCGEFFYDRAVYMKHLESKKHKKNEAKKMPKMWGYPNIPKLQEKVHGKTENKRKKNPCIVQGGINK